MGLAKKKRLVNIVLDVLLIAMLCGLYALTGSRDTQAVMARVHNAPIYRGSAKGAVALQFAVSWNAAALEDILDILAAENVRATFAVSGEWAEQNPGLLRRMVAQGHELATMGYSPLKDGGAKQMQQDVERALAEVEGAVGERPTLYFSGSRNVDVAARVCRRLGLTHVQCTIDLMCARGSGAEIINRVSTGAIDGSIILAQPTAAAREALPGVLAILRQKGYAITTTGGVMGK